MDMSLAKTAKSIGMPSTSITRNDSVNWSKKGGYAGSNSINKVRSKAVELGWKNKPSSNHTPDGSVIVNSDVLIDPTGAYALETSARYGATASDNYFHITLRSIQ